MSIMRLWFLAVTAALGGFLFGFDTIVINGAEQDIQRLWSLSGQMHGWVVSSALWGTVVGALIGGTVSDRFGRKRMLLIIGGTGYIVSLFAAAIFFSTDSGALAAASIFVFLASHGLGQGTVIWVLISEVFPQRFRAQGQSLGAFTHWIFAALVALFFPMAAEVVPAWSMHF